MIIQGCALNEKCTVNQSSHHTVHFNFMSRVRCASAACRCIHQFIVIRLNCGYLRIFDFRFDFTAPRNIQFTIGIANEIARIFLAIVDHRSTGHAFGDPAIALLGIIDNAITAIQASRQIILAIHAFERTGCLGIIGDIRARILEFDAFFALLSGPNLTIAAFIWLSAATGRYIANLTFRTNAAGTCHNAILANHGIFLTINGLASHISIFGTNEQIQNIHTRYAGIRIANLFFGIDILTCLRRRPHMIRAFRKHALAIFHHTQRLAILALCANRTITQLKALFIVTAFRVPYTILAFFDHVTVIWNAPRLTPLTLRHGIFTRPGRGITLPQTRRKIRPTATFTNQNAIVFASLCAWVITKNPGGIFAGDVVITAHFSICTRAIHFKCAVAANQNPVAITYTLTIDTVVLPPGRFVTRQKTADGKANHQHRNFSVHTVPREKVMQNNNVCND